MTETTAFQDTVISIIPTIRRSGLTRGPKVSWLLLAGVVSLIAVSAMLSGTQKNKITDRGAGLGGSFSPSTCDDKSLYTLIYDGKSVSRVPFLSDPDEPNRFRLFAEQAPRPVGPDM